MEVFAGSIVFIMLAVSLSISLSLTMIDVSDPKRVRSAIKISIITSILLFIFFSYITFSAVGKAIMPLFDFY